MKILMKKTLYLQRKQILLLRGVSKFTTENSISTHRQFLLQKGITN